MALAGLADAQELCLDPSFAGGGITTLDVRQVNNVGWTPQGLDLQPDGRIVVGGTGAEFDGGSFFAMRLTEDGRPDLSFGGIGFVEIPLGVPRPEFETIRVQVDGTLVLAGEGRDTAVMSGDDSRVVIARVSSSGVVEHVLLPRVAPSPQLVNGQVAFADERAVFAGQGRTSSADYNLFVFALFRDAGLDTSFGDAGLAVVDFAGGDEFGAAMVQDAQGRLLVPAVTYRAGQFDFGLARLTTKGALDSTFGSGMLPGRVATDFFGRDDSCEVAAAQPDGKPLCAGSVTLADGGTAVALVRYLVNGALDSSFGTGGVQLKESLPGDVLRALTVLPNGTIAVAGATHGPTGNLDVTIALFTPSGGVIPLSPTDGAQRLDLGGDESAHQLRIDSRNRLLVFGEASVDGGQNDVLVARYVFCDGGVPDAGTPDAGAPDSGAFDAGTPDAGTPDAGTSDAGTSDAGTSDAGTSDAGVMEARVPDAGAPTDGGSIPSTRSLQVGCSCDATGGLMGLCAFLLSGLRRRLR